MKLYLEYYLQLLTAPFYFILVLLFEIVNAFTEAYRETIRAWYATHRIYKGKINATKTKT